MYTRTKFQAPALFKLPSLQQPARSFDSLEQPSIHPSLYLVTYIPTTNLPSIHLSSIFCRTADPSAVQRKRIPNRIGQTWIASLGVPIFSCMKCVYLWFYLSVYSLYIANRMYFNTWIVMCSICAVFLGLGAYFSITLYTYCMYCLGYIFTIFIYLIYIMYIVQCTYTILYIKFI